MPCIPFEAKRGARTDEYLAALRVTDPESEAEFHGEFVDFDPVYCQPKPAQLGHTDPCGELKSSAKSR